MSYIAPPQSEHLMPPNATALEKALSGSDARVLDAPVDIIRDVWDPDRCPEHLLPYLAQAWSLDEWDPAWNEQDKRDAIKESIWIHQHKGTIGALKRAIARLGMNVTVSRWFEQTPRGAPYTFKLFLTLNKTAKWTKEESQRLYRTALSAKAVRSFLSSLGIYQETEPASVKTGAVVITRITTRSYYDPVDHIKTPSSYVYGGAAVVVRSQSDVGVPRIYPPDWWSRKYPGSTYAIRFSRVTTAGDSIAPTIQKTGVPVSWDFGDGTPLKSDNNGSHTYASEGTFDLTIVFYDEVANVTSLSLFDLGLSGDISALAALTDLKVLQAYKSGLSGDISALAALTDLTYLNFGNSGVSGDISALAALTALTTLSFKVTGVSGDIAALAALTDLTYLNFGNSGVSGDIAPLAVLTNLTTLSFQVTSVSGDIAPLAALTNLKYLYVDSTGISGDVSPLAALTNLIIIYLYSTNVDVNSVANGFWAARDNFTATNMLVHISGTNPNPTGIYQDVCAPTTALEKIYNLTNAQCPGDTFNTQTWIY